MREKKIHVQKFIDHIWGIFMIIYLLPKENENGNEHIHTHTHTGTQAHEYTVVTHAYRSINY